MAVVQAVERLISAKGEDTSWSATAAMLTTMVEYWKSHSISLAWRGSKLCMSASAFHHWSLEFTEVTSRHEARVLPVGLSL